MTRLLALAIAFAVLMLTLPAFAQVGMQGQNWTIPNATGGTDAVPGMVWYPSASPGKTQRFGPFEVDVATGATPTPGQHALVVISHGTGGNELGHAWLAQRLAAQGYLVVTLRHPGDNYLDRSAVRRADYFSERPRQVSRVLDQVLADARWAALIDAGRIAAIGHSAGGHTVLALAGGRLDRAHVLAHCGPQGIGLREDAQVCRLGGRSGDRPAPAAPGADDRPDVRDPRVRAVVADAPLGIALVPESLKAAGVPLLIEYGAADEVLAPRFHAEALCKALPRTTCVRSAAAGHYALFQPGTGPLGTGVDDPSIDPKGFDRRAWQAEAWTRIRDFLAAALR